MPETVPAGHGELLAFGAAVAFSMKAIFVKLAIAEGADPIALLAVRMVIAAPVFIVMAWSFAPEERPSRRDAIALLGLGLLGYHAAAALDFAGLRYVSAGLERVVLYVHPTLVVLFGAVLLARRPGWRELAGIGIAWSGLAIAVTGDVHVGDPRDVAKGVALVLACAVCYAGYLLGAESLGRRLGAVYTASVATAVSAFTLSVQVALTQPADVLALTPRALGIAVVLAIVSTVIPVVLLATAILRIGPARASTIGMVGPTLAALLGFAILGEPLSALQLGGGLIVVIGVWLSRSRPAALAVRPNPA